MNKESYSTYKHFSNLVKKEVSVIISDIDLRELKGGKYKLCFAKKIKSHDYNMVWRSYSDYLSNNTFSWVPDYQLFGTKVVENNKEIVVNTNLIDIGFGETSILDSIGLLNKPKIEGPVDSITMNNQFNIIYPGIKQLSTGINGRKNSTVSNVLPNYIIQGTAAELRPLEKILVWFEQDIVNSIFFTSPRLLSKEVDLTYIKTGSIKFENGKWD